MVEHLDDQEDPEAVKVLGLKKKERQHERNRKKKGRRGGRFMIPMT